MNVKEIIKKYEAKKADILKVRPDLEVNGDFSIDGVKLFCFNEFINVLRENDKLTQSQQQKSAHKQLNIGSVSGSLLDKYCAKCGEPLARRKHKFWCEYNNDR